MKTFPKAIVIILLTVVTTNVFANSSFFSRNYGKETYNWYLGADTIFYSAKMSGDFDKIFSKDLIGGNVFFGYRPNNMALEFGYLWTANRTKDLTINSGTQIFGTTANTNTRHTGRIRFKTTHLMVFGYIPITDNVDFRLGAGFGFARQRMSFTHTPSAAGNVQVALDQIKTKTKFMWKLGAGFEFEAGDRWGARLTYTYDNLSNLSLNATPSGVDPKIFKLAHIIGIGLYYRLN